ncbi:MAG: hypothetical protein GY943_10485 [Chloroflexi bacterium]|nr:hypothetical protein [Chloroflexota bacterium]
MDLETFKKRSHSEIAQIVQGQDPMVCVFPFNGTRRWFMLEHPQSTNFGRDYMEAATGRMAEICSLLFEHGVHTLLIPVLSPHLFQSRGDKYTQEATAALSLLATHPKLCAIYEDHDVRVRFYGDYEEYIDGHEYEGLKNQLTQLVDQTATHQSHRLLWGVCAHDAVETTASLSIQYFQKHGETPNKNALIQMYYGEQIPPVNLFISAAKPRAFDMPLLSTGREDLYFTVTPSPYFTEEQLREILFDHLYARQKTATDYESLSSVEKNELRRFYKNNQGRTLGVGVHHPQWGIWHPVPQVQSPKE